MQQQDGLYGEPWSHEIGVGVRVHSEAGIIAMMAKKPPDIVVLAERAVACVNAFSGVPHPERLPELIEALKAEAEAAKLCSEGPSMFSDGEAEHEHHRRNDRLLAANIRRIRAFRAMIGEPS